MAKTWTSGTYTASNYNVNKSFAKGKIEHLRDRLWIVHENPLQLEISETTTSAGAAFEAAQYFEWTVPSIIGIDWWTLRATVEAKCTDATYGLEIRIGGDYAGTFTPSIIDPTNTYQGRGGTSSLSYVDVTTTVGLHNLSALTPGDKTTLSLLFRSIDVSNTAYVRCIDRIALWYEYIETASDWGSPL